jgi:hypothetical protein
MIEVVVWGFVFVILLAAILVFDVADRPGGAFFVLAATVFLLWYTETFNTIRWTIDNPVASVIYVTGYFMVGVLWSLWKWDCFCAEQAKAYKQALIRWLDIPEQDRKENYKPTIDKFVPIALENKTRITYWIVFWWASMIAYVIDDILREFCEWVIKKFSTVYAKIAARHFKTDH